jgi:CPA2 family monovalent cation:H+ antiporter-2
MNTVLLLIILLAAGKWLLLTIYDEVARGRSEETFLLTTLVIVLIAVWLTHSFHLSMALGGLVTGMMLGEGWYQFQIQSDIRPFRVILLGLFFVTIGLNLDLALLLEYYSRIIAFTIGFIVIKTLVVSFLVKTLGFSSKDSLEVGTNLAQAGEFGLALMALALRNGIVPPDQASFFTIIATFSMIASPVLIRRASDISRRFLNNNTQNSKALPVRRHVKITLLSEGSPALVQPSQNFLRRITSSMAISTT